MTFSSTRIFYEVIGKNHKVLLRTDNLDEAKAKALAEDAYLWQTETDYQYANHRCFRVVEGTAAKTQVGP